MFTNRMQLQVHLTIPKIKRILLHALYALARRDVRCFSGSFPQVNVRAHFILRPRGANVRTHDRGTHINANRPCPVNSPANSVQCKDW